MKRSIPIITCLLLVVVLASAAPIAARPGNIPGQAVIRLAGQVLPQAVLRGTNAHVRAAIADRHIYLVDLPANASLNAFLRQMRRKDAVIFAEPNYNMELPEVFQATMVVPDDAKPPLLVGVSPESFYDQAGVYAIGVDSACLLSTGVGVTVAVIDNGVDLLHPLFAARLTPDRYDFYNGDNDPTYEVGAVQSHGTFVAGLVLRTAPDCQIMPLQAFGGDGVGSSYAVANAIYYAISHGADVINMSFGTTGTNQVMADACSAAVAAGLSLVAAAGNGTVADPMYPAAYPGVIAVSGTDTLELLADFSNFGDHIDLCAPAVRLYSSMAGEFQWGTWSGTSFAAPLVSATCALVRAVEPTYGAQVMETHLQQTAETDLLWGTITVPNIMYGYGRLDVATAVWSTVSFVSGDLNGNGQLDPGDALLMSRYLTSSMATLKASAASLDLDCNGVVDQRDVEYLINHVFKAGPPPRRCR